MLRGGLFLRARNHWVYDFMNSNSITANSHE